PDPRPRMTPVAEAPSAANAAPANTAPAQAAPEPQPATAAPRITLDMLRNAGFVAIGPANSRSRVTEELSVVQHQVRRTVQATEAVPGRLPRLVLVTSAKPGEGKTFCSVNVAARLAIGSPDQVVLVDGDGKQMGSLTHLLGQDDTPGLRLLSLDHAQRPESLLLKTDIDRLSFLPYGPPKPGVQDLPSGAMLADAVARLSAALPNRIIIFDAPPCLYTSEPTALASVAGQVLLVVRAESTQRDEVEAALDMVEACPNLQLVLNQTQRVSSNTFGAYGYYGYYNG
ncbi:CpsD/CapB family tyrosine-protein kinase, partial [Falsiroseomonas oryzae]|uniref:CpsD/CapB family tyrosine-protein kinase n=1 Tax=Falsiroseomonas oryzae TaxID=2766473 RepID=UPI0022EB48F4